MPILLLLATAFLFAAHAATHSVQAPVGPEPILVEAGQLPETRLSFVENQGQWPAPARFVARRGGFQVRIEDHCVLLQKADPDQAGHLVRISMEDPSPDAVALGMARKPGVSHFFLGDQAQTWRRDVASFDRVKIRGIQEEVDLYWLDSGGCLKYDLVLAPGAALEKVVFRAEGITSLSIAGDGSLVMETPIGPIRQPQPTTWQVLPDGQRRMLESHFRLLDGGRFGFRIPQHNPELGLVIDPGLEWSTFLGGSDLDLPSKVLLHPSGDLIVAGRTGSADFPVTPGAFETTYQGPPGISNGGDVFVSRLSPDGTTLVWSTFLGSHQRDFFGDMAVDASGRIAVTGSAEGTFPTTAGAFDTSWNGAADVFVTQLTADGASLVWSTYLGGSSWDSATGLAIGSQGEITVAGLVSSTNFPTTAGAYATTFQGGEGDGFVTRLSADGSALQFSTYLGGTSGLNENISALCVGPAGDVTVVGRTQAPDFPTTAGSFDTSFNGYIDAFVTRLAADGSHLLYSTFLGGSAYEAPTAVVFHQSGEVAVAGFTESMDFPTVAGSFDTSGNGGWDGFAARLSSDGSRLVYSTFLGGGGWDYVQDLDLDASGCLTVVGYSYSTDLPSTPGAWAESNHGGLDGFMVRFNSSCSGIAYASYLGAAAGDYITALALDGPRNLFVTGDTESTGFPVTANVFQDVHHGARDGFLTRFEITGLVLSQSVLQRGQPAFLDVNGANQGESVYFLYSLAGTGSGPSSSQLGGMNLDLLTPITLLGSEVADVSGHATLSLTVPSQAPLVDVFTQAVARRGPGGVESVKSNVVTAIILP